jgi:hypothetical protein
MPEENKQAAPQEQPPESPVAQAEAANKFLAKPTALLLIIGACGLLVLVAIFGIAFWRVMSNMKEMLSDSPAEFEAVEAKPGEYDGIQERIAQVQASSGEMILTARALTLLLTDIVRRGSSSEAKALVELAPPAHVNARVSQPVSAEGGKKWLNIEMSARLSPCPAGLQFTYDSIKVGKADLKEWLGVEIKGNPGMTAPGALLEAIIPRSATSASVNQDGALVLGFAVKSEKTDSAKE